MQGFRFVVLVVVLSAISRTAADPPTLPAPAQGKIDFRRDIYPLLTTHCFKCHQGAEAASGYRLDLRAEVLGETNGKPLVQLGQGGKSRLIDLVASKRMPRKSAPLNDHQIGLLRAWIDQGLAWD